MGYFKHAIIGLALAGALAAPAFAAGEGGEGFRITEGTIVLTTPSGMVTQKKVTDAAMADTFMKEGTPLGAGVMIMMHGGKLYIMNDKKMPDGRMFSDGARMGGGG
jgi:hypothetical protein